MKLSKFCNKISLILQALWCAVLYFLIEPLCSGGLGLYDGKTVGICL